MQKLLAVIKINCWKRRVNKPNEDCSLRNFRSYNSTEPPRDNSKWSRKCFRFFFVINWFNEFATSEKYLNDVSIHLGGGTKGNKIRNHSPSSFEAPPDAHKEQLNQNVFHRVCSPRKVHASHASFLLHFTHRSASLQGVTFIFPPRYLTLSLELSFLLLTNAHNTTPFSAQKTQKAASGIKTKHVTHIREVSTLA